MTSMRADTMNFYKETMNRLTDAYANSQSKPSEQAPSERNSNIRTTTMCRPRDCNVTQWRNGDATVICY